MSNAVRRCVLGTSVAASAVFAPRTPILGCTSSAVRCEASTSGCPVLRKPTAVPHAALSITGSPNGLHTASFSTSGGVTTEEDMSTPLIREKYPAEKFPHLARSPRMFIGPADVVKLYTTTKADVLSEIEADSVMLPKDMDLLDTKRWRVTLYQFDSCPFCRKVRACLDYLSIPYEVEEVHPLTKRELKAVCPEYKKVPVLRIEALDSCGGNVVLTDSKRIVHNLMRHCNALPTAREDADRYREAEWIRWTDNVLVQLIVLNIYRNLQESAETFKYLSSNDRYTMFEKLAAQISGTVVMWLVSLRRRRKFEVLDPRAALYAAVRDFLDARSEGKNFIGGDKPNEADINVYGILRSIDGFASERDLWINVPEIKTWMNFMRTHRLQDFAAPAQRAA